MEFHEELISAAQNSGLASVNVYKLLFEKAKRKWGHIGTGEKIALKREVEYQLDVRLSQYPEFFQGRYTTGRINGGDTATIGNLLDCVVHNMKFN